MLDSLEPRCQQSRRSLLSQPVTGGSASAFERESRAPPLGLLIGKGRQKPYCGAGERPEGGERQAGFVRRAGEFGLLPVEGDDLGLEGRP